MQEDQEARTVAAAEIDLIARVLAGLLDTRTAAAGGVLTEEESGRLDGVQRFVERLAEDVRNG